MVATLLRPPLDELVLPAGDALSFVDAATGALVEAGLRCRLVLRGNGRVLALAAATPSGVHHWPDLPARWRQPDPAAPVLADVVVLDERQRYLPLALPWPLPATPTGQVIGGSVLGSSRLMRANLLSAPGRPTPPGLAGAFGLLAWQASGQPASWARVRLTDGDGRVHEGGTDAAGRLALHLPQPRPNKPGSPPSPASALAVFADPALRAASERLGAPDVLAFAAQPAVRALANAGGDAPYMPPVFIVGEPLIFATLGLPSAQRELRLTPI